MTRLIPDCPATRESVAMRVATMLSLHPECLDLDDCAALSMVLNEALLEGASVIIRFRDDDGDFDLNIDGEDL